MPITCNIEFEKNESCTFYAGQELSTKIILNLNETKEVKGVALRIHGYGQMRWSNDDDSYSGAEDYINIKTFLLGKPDAEPVKLQAGDHVFSYKYRLPITCPSSVESQFGQICYKVKVMLIRPWKFDKSFTKGFTVIKLVDLNQQLRITSPIERKIVKKFGSGPMETPPLTMSVSLPKSGYVSGQKIPVSIAISNESGKHIKELKISLAMIVTCYSQIPSRNVFDNVCKVSKLKAEPPEDQINFSSMFELPVPPTPPSDDQNSGLVHISYQVEVETVMPKMTPNQAVLVPIIIGNVPFLDVCKTTSSSGIVVKNYKETETKCDFTGIDSTQAVITPLLAPTFEKAVYMPRVNLLENDQDICGDNEFVPSYPVFKSI